MTISGISDNICLNLTLDYRGKETGAPGRGPAPCAGGVPAPGAPKRSKEMAANPPESCGFGRRGRRRRLVIVSVFSPRPAAEVAALALLLGPSYGAGPPSPPAEADRGPTPGPAGGGDERGPAQ